MADDESFLDEDVTGGQDVEVSQKTGFIPALAFKILKWAAIAIAAIIFIVTGSPKKQNEGSTTLR